MNKILNFTNMKKSILTIILSLYSVLSFSQAASNFTGAVDDKWSTAGNWSAGIPVAATKVTLLKSVTLDVDATIKQLKTTASSDASVVVTGDADKVLTITGTGVGQPIQIGGTGKHLDLTGVSVDMNPGDGTEALAINGANSNLTLGEFSSSQHTNMFAQAGIANPRTITLNGAYTSTKWIQFKSNSTVVFGENYDPTNHTNQMRFLDNAQGPARVTVKGTNWLKAGLKIIAVKTGTLTLDGENAMKGSIELQTTAGMNLNVNKNQSAKTITMGSGTLTITMGDDVTSLAFADNSAANWGTGKIVISNFKDDVISFGTDANGLTAEQLAQIDIGGGQVELGSDGKLAVVNNEVAASTFNNATGDKLWSTAGNWSNGIPNVSTAKIILTDSMILDTDFELSQIKLGGGTGDVNVTSNNGSTLTINGKNVTAPIQNNRGNSSLILDLKVVINSTDAFENIQANAAGTCSVVFGESSELTTSVLTKLLAQNDRTIVFNGLVKDAEGGILQVGAASEVIFGSTSNFQLETDIVLLGNNTVLTSNTADQGNFISSGFKIKPDSDKGYGHVVTLNGKNTFKGNILVKDTAITYNFNADQTNMGTITMGAGNLNLRIGSGGVDTIAFADNSSADWGNGKIVVTDFSDNVIGFGNSNSGITKAQLAQIDVGGTALKLSSTGELESYDIANERLLITGVLDGDLPGGYPKVIELYAETDIWDLAKYGIDVASNGKASTKPDYYLQSGSLAAGKHYIIGRKSGAGQGGFDDWFGEAADMYTNGNTMNGDDAIALYKITSSDTVNIDVAGAVGTDGTGEPWEYTDGWLYRNHATKANTTFNMDDWTACKKCADTYTKNSDMAKPFPKGTYMPTLPEKLMITGILDGDLSGGYPKALELYAVTDIADLSKYGIDVASNGKASSSSTIDYYLDAGTLTAGNFYHIGRRSGAGQGGFDDWFGVAADMYTNGNTFNGDDAVVLYHIDGTDTVTMDVAGALGTDGTGEPWEYTDGWLYRKNGKEAKTTFAVTDWTACKKCADTYSKNSDMPNPFPYEGYSSDTSPTSVYLQASEGSVDESAGTYAVSVLIADPSPDSATVVHFVYTGSNPFDINNFTSDTLTFPAGSSAAQTVNIPIKNDDTPEGEVSHTFALQNLSGGYQSALSSPNTFTLTILDDDLGEFNMVFNEMHIDPASDITGDANGDGTRDAIADEFIELINNGSSAFDLSGYYLTDSEEPNSAARHIFPEGTIVDAGQAVVVFGGGIPVSPTNFGGAIVHTASENNGGVALGNSGRTVMVKNSDGLTVLSQAYDAAQGGINQSITRSPDITGTFVSHSGVSAANGALFSPGMKLDSTNFYDHTSTKVQFQVLKGSYKEGEDASFTLGVTINGASSTNATEVTVASSGVGNGNLGDVDGFTPQTITFDAGSSATQYVTINITNDDLEEGNENIEFGLFTPSGGDNVSIGSPSKFMLTLSDDDVSNPLVLNEVLTDPPSDDAATTDVVEGDANGDGTRSFSDDEFVELVNTNSVGLDISGYTIYDNVGLRHTFAEGSFLSGGGVALVFGGGSPTGEFGGADIVTTASGGSLALTNTGDKVVINDKNGNQIIEFEYGGSTTYDGGSDQSLTRDPDLTGDFVLHSTTVAGGVYSPGTQTDGSVFDVGLNDPTTIQFALREFTLANNDGSYDLQDYSIEVAISNPSATIATQAQVVFTASDNGSAADLNNYVGEVITFGSGTSDSQNSVVKITNSNIALGTRYDFALLNVSGGNAATIGENSTFTLIVGDPGSVPLSIENERAGVTISPNPTSDFINVKIDKNKVLERYFVTDMSGAYLETKGVNKVVDHIRIDARNFNNGLYILGLNFEGESVKLKFIKR